MKNIILLLFMFFASCSHNEATEQINFKIGKYESVYFPENFIKINTAETITINIEGHNFTTSEYTVNDNSIHLVYENKEYSIFKTTTETELMVTSGELNFGWFKIQTP